jgi:hypothetical protein
MNQLPARQNTAVTAILPTTIDETWRIARMAVMGNMAPKSLVEGKDADDATSACAIAIMAGAELGLTPLMALRSYAVVNGRPSLWGDGIKAVVRQSGRCEYIKSGGDMSRGWCEAKRSDTGEVLRVEFTMEQAKRARLDQKTGPWKDYPDMMMQRRATSRCLNDLFADVLGGIVSSDEAQDSTPFADETGVTEAKPSTQPPAPPPEEDATDVQPFDAAEFANRIMDKMADATSEEELVAMWEAEQVDIMLLEHNDWLDSVYDARNQRLAQFEDAPEADGEVTEEDEGQ